MLKTLHGKLSLVLLGLLCLTGVLQAAVTFFTTRLYLQEVNQRLSRTLAEHLTEERTLFRDGRVHEETVAEIKKLMAINPHIEVYLLDAQGAILAYSAPPGKVKRRRVSLGPVRRFLSGKAALPIVGDDPRDLSREKTFSVSPVPVNGPTQGYVYLVLGGEEYDSAAEILRHSYILRLSAGFTAGSGAVALVAGLLMFHLLTRRLRSLTGSVEAFRQAGFQPHAEFPPACGAPPGDEIDHLHLAFTGMGARIKAQIAELQRADLQRRELVGNVSHDLRTPLTALRGYLETLQIKSDELTPDERRNYVAMAVKHTDRLGKLVAELFELAKLDSREAQIRAEPFSAAELVQDVAQKYHLAADQKGLSLTVELPESLAFVWADIGLIERVLENLVDNAIRFTPEGGVVTLSLAHEGEGAEPGRVRVQVRDTGYGIRQEDLPYIFDRSYQAEQSGTDAEGAGLGLTIARRILELHGSEIEVSSTFNGGTMFTFHLPECNAAPAS